MRILDLSGRSCYLDRTLILITKLQGNVKQFDGRINNHNSDIEGLIDQTVSSQVADGSTRQRQAFRKCFLFTSIAWY